MNQKNILLVGGLFAFLVVIAFLTFNNPVVSGDLAEWINNPIRMLHGDMPYIDFWLLFTPYEVLLPAVIYLVFGINVNLMLLISNAILPALVGVFVFLLVRKYMGKSRLALLAALLIFFNGISFEFLDYTYVYFLFLLGAVYFFVDFINPKIESKKTLLFCAGIMIGFAFLFRVYVVGAFFTAMLITLAIETRKIKPMLFFIAGTAVILLVMLLPFINLWVPMVEQVLFKSVSTNLTTSVPYFYHMDNYLRMLPLAPNIFHAGYLFLRLLNTFFAYLLPFICASAFLWLRFKKKLTGETKAIATLLFFWMVLSFPKAMSLSFISHLGYTILPAILLLVLLWWESFKTENKFINVWIGVTILILLIPVLTFAVPLAYELGREQYKVSAPYGELPIKNPEEARDIQKVINYITENTNEGDYIFVTPWFAPPFYALTNRLNPTYYDSLGQVIFKNDENDQKKICEDLIQAKTKVIVHNPDFGFSSDGGGITFRNQAAYLQSCIEENFNLVEEFGRYQIYIWGD